MPRLPRQLLATARKDNPLLALLLRPCREIQHARLELKWLEEHAQNIAEKKHLHSWKPLLGQLCRARSKGKPLQYILGTEFFGELELRCSPGVLIPRQDTAAYVTYLTILLERHASQLPPRLKVLDLCSGSGCIPLLFAHLWAQSSVRKIPIDVTGLDISPKAVRLAKRNQREQAAKHPQSTIKDIDFIRADMLNDGPSITVPSLLDCLGRREQMHWDIIISNPPYISPKHFNHITTRSVRNFEPRLALVPDPGDLKLSDNDQGDFFYPRLLQVARELDAKVLLTEVGDLEQAKRVAILARAFGQWDGVEIWRDEPDEGNEQGNIFDGVAIRGQGNGRSVICWRGPGGLWLDKIPGQT